jgi:serine protease Do
VKSLLLSLVLALTLSCSSCNLSRSVKDLYIESGPAVLLLETESGHCSSFHIGNGLILTAAHCIDGQGLEVVHLDKETHIKHPTVLLDNDEQDIAILSVPEAKNLPFAVLGELPSIGERLTTIGFPGYWNDKTIDVGYVIGIGVLDNTSVVFGSGNAFPGESGGPVLDERGFVVGLVSRISPRGIMYMDGRHLHRDVSVFIAVDQIQKEVHKLLTER